jgi:hypothetical protein
MGATRIGLPGRWHGLGGFEAIAGIPPQAHHGIRDHNPKLIWVNFMSCAPARLLSGILLMQ